MATFNFYRPQANHYIRIIRQSDGAVWDTVAGALSAGPGWAASAIALTWNSVIEGYPVEIPNLPVATYDILFYDNASPTSGDEVIYGQEHSRV